MRAASRRKRATSALRAAPRSTLRSSPRRRLRSASSARARRERSFAGAHALGDARVVVEALRDARLAAAEHEDVRREHHDDRGEPHELRLRHGFGSSESAYVTPARTGSSWTATRRAARYAGSAASDAIAVPTAASRAPCPSTASVPRSARSEVSHASAGRRLPSAAISFARNAPDRRTASTRSPSARSRSTSRSTARTAGDVELRRREPLRVRGAVELGGVQARRLHAPEHARKRDRTGERGERRAQLGADERRQRDADVALAPARKVVDAPHAAVSQSARPYARPQSGEAARTTSDGKPRDASLGQRAQPDRDRDGAFERFGETGQPCAVARERDRARLRSRGRAVLDQRRRELLDQRVARVVAGAGEADAAFALLGGRVVDAERSDDRFGERAAAGRERAHRRGADRSEGPARSRVSPTSTIASAYGNARISANAASSTATGRKPARFAPSTRASSAERRAIVIDAALARARVNVHGRFVQRVRDEARRLEARCASAFRAAHRRKRGRANHRVRGTEREDAAAFARRELRACGRDRGGGVVARRPGCDGDEPHRAGRIAFEQRDARARGADVDSERQRRCGLHAIAIDGEACDGERTGGEKRSEADRVAAPRTAREQQPARIRAAEHERRAERDDAGHGAEPGADRGAELHVAEPEARARA